MTLVFISKVYDPAEWSQALRAHMPDLDIRIWPEVGDPRDVECVLVWKAPPGDLQRYPNLRLIQTFGAGADQLLEDPTVPPAVPIARIVDPRQTAGMVEYVLYAVLRHHRRFDEYERFRARGEYTRLPHVDAGERRVGVMGLGALGCAAARQLAQLGFDVAGWGRSLRQIEGVTCLHGAGQLEAFLARTEILVCLLPLTPETEGILDRRSFAALPRGACVVNVGRGRHVVEADLIAALDSGQLDGATLDVSIEEPLPPGHPFWRHPRVCMTPHIATLTTPRGSAAQIVENYRRARAGLPLLNRVDRRAGY
jgi:glyoxylate/hydroxypyruvate reductase A